MGSTSPPGTVRCAALDENDHNNNNNISANNATSNGDDANAVNDERFILPKCVMPPRDEMEQMEVFVANAVREQHQQQQRDAGAAAVVVPNYKVIIDAFRLKKDVKMIEKLLIALRTCSLSLLASDSVIHARLIHNIVRFVPFAPSTIRTQSPSNQEHLNHENLNDDTKQNPNTKEEDLATIDCDTSLADAQFHFLAALISANTVFLVPTLTALWKMLTTGSSSSIHEAHPLRCRRIHAALATITRLCPQAKTELLPIVQSHTPFRRKPHAELIFYYQQCLTVLEYIPPLLGPVLELILHRCLEIDVDIQITDHGEATIDSTENHDDDNRDNVHHHHDESMFALDMEDERSTVPTPGTTNVVVTTTVDETADKLDSLLLLVFQYVERILDHRTTASPLSPSSSTNNPSMYHEIFHILSRVFESAILMTHKSKFVQFVMLHICGLEESRQQSHAMMRPPDNDDDDTSLLYREFASNLIHIVLDPYKATVTRQSAACYLASFISRSNYVCPETVRESIDALLRWAEAYIESLTCSTAAGGPAMHAPDVREQCNMHSLFYTVCQAAFYIMCFRGVEVVRFVRPPVTNEDPSQPVIDLGTVRWSKLCAHPLVPLKYCLESVRTEFLRISKLFSILDEDLLNQLLNKDQHNVFHPPQRKKKTSLISTPATLEKERLRGGVGGLGRGTNPLDSFFPFDPYLLRRSHSHIEPFFNHWDGGASADSYALDDDGDDDDDTAIIVDGDSEDESIQRVHGSDLNDDDSLSESDDDDDDDDDGEDVTVEEESNNIIRRKRLMSFASNATSISSRPSSVEDRHPDEFLTTKRIEMKKAWSTIIKRPRAPSCSENGSW